MFKEVEKALVLHLISQRAMKPVLCHYFRRTSHLSFPMKILFLPKEMWKNYLKTLLSHPFFSHLFSPAARVRNWHFWCPGKTVNQKPEGFLLNGDFNEKIEKATLKKKKAKWKHARKHFQMLVVAIPLEASVLWIWSTFFYINCWLVYSNSSNWAALSIFWSQGRGRLAWKLQGQLHCK